MTIRHGSSRRLGRLIVALAFVPTLLLIWTGQTSGDTGRFVRVYRSAAMNSTSAGPAIAWDAETSDADAWHTGSGSTLVVPAGLDGTYVLDVQARWTGVTGDAKELTISLNGSVVSRAADVGTNVTINAAWTGTLAAADSIAVSIFSSSTQAVTVGSTHTWLSLARVEADSTAPPFPTWPPVVTPNPSEPMNIAQFTGEAAATLATLQDSVMYGIGALVAATAALIIIAAFKAR